MHVLYIPLRQIHDHDIVIVHMCNSTNMVRHYIITAIITIRVKILGLGEWPEEVLKLPLKYKWDSAKNGAFKMHRYAQSKSGPQNQI